MAALDRYQRRFEETYTTNSQGQKYLRRAQTNYLHFHTGNITVLPPSVIQNAKDQILQHFAYGMAKNSQQLTTGPLSQMSFEKIRDWLKEWTTGDTGGVIGQEIGNTIAEKLQNDPYTGAGIAKGFEMVMTFGGAMTSSGKFSTSGENLVAEADYLMNQVWEYLGRYVRIFEDAGEEALVLKCLEISGKGGNSKVGADILAKYNGRKITPIEESRLSKKVNSSFSSLDEIIDTLQQIISQGKGGASGAQIGRSFGNKKKWKPQQLAKQLGGIFNSLGGEQVGEIVGMTAAQEVLERGDKEIKAKINQLFMSSGGPGVTVSVIKTGEDTIKLQNTSLPVQQKGDWSISITKGNVTVNIPVSSKLNQRGNGNRVYASIGEPFNGTITAQSQIGLDQLLAITLNGPVDWLEQHMAALSDGTIGFRADLGDMGDPAAFSLWQEFKEAAKYTGLFRALVGTGKTTKNGIDFASLLIINSQIYSIADILTKFVQKPSLFSTMPHGPEEIPDWPSVRRQVSGMFYGQWMHYIPIEHRLKTQYSAIRALYGKKYSFIINMGSLGWL